MPLQPPASAFSSWPAVSCTISLALASLPIFVTSVGAAPGDTATGPPVEAVLSRIEALESLGRLHSDPQHPWIQEFWILGRYHGQHFWADGPGDDTDGYEHRRARIGAQGRFFEKLTLHAQMISGSDFEPHYNGFTELWAQWAFNSAIALTVGQQKHRFTHERNVSSRYLNTLERGLLINMMGLDYTPAVTLSGRAGQWSYYTGLFSNITNTDMGRSFSEYNAGWSFLGSLTCDLGRSLGTDAAHWNFCVLHSAADANATHLNRYENAVSSALILSEGPVSLIVEGLVGSDDANGDAYGLTIHPGWFITDKLQLAGRYQIAAASESRGLRAQRRYERPAGLTSGDCYQAAYAGLNYYILGHRLKVMGGVEYAQLGDEEAWTASLAMRLFWGPHSSGPFPMGKLLKAR